MGEITQVLDVLTELVLKFFAQVKKAVTLLNIYTLVKVGVQLQIPHSSNSKKKYKVLTFLKLWK